MCISTQPPSIMKRIWFAVYIPYINKIQISSVILRGSLKFKGFWKCIRTQGVKKAPSLITEDKRYYEEMLKEGDFFRCCEQ